MKDGDHGAPILADDGARGNAASSPCLQKPSCESGAGPSPAGNKNSVLSKRAVLEACSVLLEGFRERLEEVTEELRRAAEKHGGTFRSRAPEGPRAEPWPPAGLNRLCQLAQAVEAQRDLLVEAGHSLSQYEQAAATLGDGAGELCRAIRELHAPPQGQADAEHEQPNDRQATPGRLAFDGLLEFASDLDEMAERWCLVSTRVGNPQTQAALRECAVELRDMLNRAALPDVAPPASLGKGELAELYDLGERWSDHANLREILQAVEPESRAHAPPALSFAPADFATVAATFGLVTLDAEHWQRIVDLAVEIMRCPDESAFEVGSLCGVIAKARLPRAGEPCPETARTGERPEA
jgi:hypothetical protein